MRIHRTVLASLALGGALCLSIAGNAMAATVSWEETAAGLTGNGTGTDYTHLPVSDHYGSSFGPSAGDLAAAPGFSFYDDFIFTVASSTVDAVTSTIDLGKLLQIDDLQVRLYTLAGNPTLPVLSDSPAGLKAGGWSTPVDFSAAGQTGEFSVLPETMLAAGTYVLEVRGEVKGTGGGSYSGTINLSPVSPVPLPAALALLVSGLGALGGLARKRSARVSAARA
jgi:hypothetical protein